SLSKTEAKESPDWAHDHQNLKIKKKSPLTSSFLVKFLVVCILFFTLSIAVSGYIIYNQSNVISSDNVVFTINTPSIIKAGEISRFGVSISNSNRVSLENVEMLVEFPDGSRSALDPNQSLERFKD